MPPNPEIRRVLIANRGEIALRAIRVCRRIGIETVAIYSQADAASPHIWAADDAVCVGPPAATKSYLAAQALVHIACQKECDAVYPGYGFLSENAAFADLCAQHGIKFIGPAAETIRDMGDKSRAREIAVKFDVPVVPGSDVAYDDQEAAAAAADQIGFPLLLKARSGGGGRGMRVVEEADAFVKSFAEAHREAEGAFGDGALYMERFFDKVRHVEVQVFGDGRGRAVAFDERDCSVQRRHQKLVEESPSPAIDPELRDRLKDAALRLTRGLKYEGAGTVEFIYAPGQREFFFIEMNTRIQVEHTVTEMRIGADLVEWQFDIASGRLDRFRQPSFPAAGHAIEFRINAENWQKGFAPSPGQLKQWRLPKRQGVRLDTAAYRQQQVTPFYDSMIAKLIVLGRDREDAIAKSREVLDSFRVEGVETTIGFHRRLLDHDDFLSDRFHTRWIENDMRMQDMGAPE